MFDFGTNLGYDAWCLSFLFKQLCTYYAAHKLINVPWHLNTFFSAVNFNISEATGSISLIFEKTFCKQTLRSFYNVMQSFAGSNTWNPKMSNE